MLLPLTGVAATASLSIESFDIKAGETKEMVIDLTNSGDITLVQFDLRLPAGLTLKQTDGEYDIDIAGRTTWRKHSLDANAQADGSIRFLLASSSNAVLSGNSGAIISMTLTASSTFSSGDIRLENILMVSPNEEELRQATVTYTIGKQEPAGTAALSIEAFSITAGGEAQMLIDLSNPDDEITLVQFDLRLPAGLSLKQTGGEYDIDIAGRTTWRKHSLDANAQPDGSIRFLLASSSNAVLSGTEGALISMTLTASSTFSSGDIRLENILMVTPQEEEIKQDNYTLRINPDSDYKVGDVFVGKDAHEQIPMLFSVIDPVAKTCQVGYLDNGSMKAAIEETTNIGIEVPSIAFPIDKPDMKFQVKKIGTFAFAVCNELTSIIIPEGVEEIGFGAFEECSNLESVSLPKSLGKINNTAFMGAVKLSSVIIPENVYSIGAYAFRFCEMDKVTVLSEEPCEIDDKTFGEYTYSHTLYVPKGAKVKYQAAVGWKNFKNIVEEGTPVPEPNSACLSIEPFGIKQGETKEMVINLTNLDDEITLVQFDLRLPAGLSLKQTGGEYDFDIAGRTTWRKHSLDANAQSDGSIRFLLASSSNSVLNGTEGAIIKMTLIANNSYNNGSIMLKNILLVTPDEKEIKPADVVFTPTGLHGIYTDSPMDSAVFSLSGQRIAAPKKGINIVGGKKVVVK